ncbi:energy transducer TonB [Chitinimonas sp. BJYL2]|uniref:energy transducer TonB n=1 Tax=Chitinimonas sp. BJYL2 TaxID=2976696 RepID=UPI0022B591E0|nr:energy transducer TonB [Chitinimonas sp. BJYL2]
MSALAASALDVSHSSRRALRRAPQVRQLTLVSSTPHPLAPAELIRLSVSRPAIRKHHWIAIGSVVLAVHALFAWRLSQSHPTDAPPKALKPVTVEFAKPVIEELPPPKPAEPPPPRAQKALPKAESVPANTPVVAIPVDDKLPVSDAPAAIVPPAPPPPAPVEKVTEPFGKAGYLNNPAPEYPEFAQSQGWEGKVVLRVRVLATGKVDALEIQQSSGRKLLDDAASKAIKGWTFAPAKRGQTPIDGWATVPIVFRL